MSRGIGNRDNPSSTWFWKDWDYDTSRLTLAEKGMWVDLIGACSCSPSLGEWTGPLSSLMGYGETLESCWRMIQGLGSKKIAEIEVMIGGAMVALTPENYPEWEAFKPVEMTPLKVVCRRLVRLRERNEKNAAQMAKVRGEKEDKSHSNNTERTPDAHSTNTECTPEVHSNNTERTPETVNTCARTSPISSTKVEDNNTPVGKKKRKTVSVMVDEAFVDEMKEVYRPLGVDVDVQRKLAEIWTKNHNRKMTRRFFQETWLTRAVNDVLKYQSSPRAALAAARAAGEPTGERPCLDFDGVSDLGDD